MNCLNIYKNSNKSNLSTVTETSKKKVTSCDKLKAHTDSNKKQPTGKCMNITLEFAPTGNDEEIWSNIRHMLLAQYMERNKTGSMQRESEALYSSSLKGIHKESEEKQ